MNTSKKINVNFSSLVGLKAELLRKQAEVKILKSKRETQPNVPKPKVKRKKVKEKIPKTEGDCTEIEDAGTLRKSKLMLEAKTLLYEKLRKTGGADGRNYLVDFGRKSESSDDEIGRDDDYEDANSDPEDDWVEYEDCFGRTRKCLRRDLPKMREKDDVVKREISKEPETEERRRDGPSEPAVVIPQKEPEIEMMRKKWEEQTERLADKTDIHYQDVLFDEARAHGVGYYAFSQNEEERAKQQDNLAKLRRETERRQKETKEIKDGKEKMEFNRLKAATIRRRVRMGLPPELTEDEETALRTQIKLRNSDETEINEKDENAGTIDDGSKVGIDKSRKESGIVVVEDKIKAFGELLGKRPKWQEMSQEEWIHKRRRDRLGEFAPVYENFRRSGSLRATRDNRITTREDVDEDPVRINAAGPEPTDRWETEGPIYDDADVEEKIEKITIKTEDSTIRNEPPVLVDDYEDTEENQIGRLAPSGPTNSGPPTFVNSFVPRRTSEKPPLRISFDRKIPPPPIVNFSVPPPTTIHPVAMAPSVATKISTFSADDSSDSNDSVIIGPVPPPSMNENCRKNEIDHLAPSFPENPTPPTFINSFVPRPTGGEPSQRVSFAQKIPRPPIVNFSVPPPSMILPVASTQSDPTEISDASGDNDSSDSDDSAIIGPVPPPSMNVLKNIATEKCGPRLIDENYLNMISDIPLPAAVQFPNIDNRFDDSSVSNTATAETSQSDTKTANNLEAVAAGLKYLRRKFEQTH